MDDQMPQHRFLRQPLLDENHSVLLEARACLHSSHPENGGDEVDHRGEAFVGLFVARGNASKRFDAAEKVFDEVSPLVFLPIMLGVPGRSFAQRNHGFDGVGAQPLA